MSNELMDYKVSRIGWPRGEWDAEPDRIQWEHRGMVCLMVRSSLGNWCGYAAVPPGHPMFEKEYNDVDYDLLPSVHGGLTYSDHCQGHICHVPPPGSPDNVWWLGFDCAHFQDYVPGMDRLELRSIGCALMYRDLQAGRVVYRSRAYVQMETERLAQGLTKLGSFPHKQFFFIAQRFNLPELHRKLTRKWGAFRRATHVKVTFNPEFVATLRRWRK